MNKIAFFGPASSGKTWCANYIIEKDTYEKVSFAAKLKEIAADLFGVTGKDGNDRTILQLLGSKLRDIRPTVWIDYLLNKVEDIKLSNDLAIKHTVDEPECTWPHEILSGVVLDDLRYRNEAVALKADGWTLVMVTAPSEVRASRLSTLYPNADRSVYYHMSETEWLTIDPDYIVTSVDPDQTKKQLDALMEILNG